MIDIYLLVDILVIVALLGLGVVVFLKDRSLASNRTFLYFVIAIAIWIITNYISNDVQQSPQTATLANYLVFSSSYFAFYFLLRFAIILTEDNRAKTIIRWLKNRLIIVGLISASPLVVAGVEIQEKVYAVVFGPAISVYAAGLLFMLFAVTFVLGTNLRRTHGSHHDRIRSLFVSFVLSIPLLVVVQFILPVATGWFGLTNVGVLLILGIVYGFYSAVVRHHLFDLRPIIVRSVAYILTLGILSGLYGVVSHYLSMVVTIQENEAVHLVVNTLFIILVVFSYQPLKNIFRRLTNRLFYQDVYDGEELLTRLNRLLVAVMDMKYFLPKTAQLLVDTMNIEYCRISIYSDSENDKVRSFGSSGPAVDPEDMRKIQAFIQKNHQRMIIAERIPSKHQYIKDILTSYNIAIILRLISTTEVKNRIGYALLGPKKSGYAYYDNDRRVLETIAGELTIATQNALHFEEIQQFNVTLQQKVDEATRKLKATNEKLKKMDETKDEFISMASHQLRTPLTSVKGYVSMVLDGDVGPINEQQRELLNQSFGSSQRMANLISDLLNLSRINTGKFVIENAPVYLPKIIESELQQLREMAQAKNVELVVETPPTFPTLMLDENKMHQVIMNLIDNAIYYTPAGGKVTVQLTETPAAVEFRVIDTGIGVPRDVQHHLFSKMFRAENAQRARPDGTGLGLFLVKKVVVSQGGAIIFDSVENKGSTFGFHFSKKDHLVTEPVAEVSSDQT